MTTPNSASQAESPSADATKYLRLVVRTHERGKLYKKDFDARSVFGAFLAGFISDLIHDGTVHEGEYYTALIIPRYGGYQRARPRIGIDPEKAAEARKAITLEFEDRKQPDRPISYFTVELRVRERSIIYREDFTLRELLTFFKRIAAVLLNLGVLGSGETFIPELYAREDGSADLERDEVYALQQDAESLIELVDAEPGASEPEMMPERSLDYYDIDGTIGEAPAEGEVQILISRSALDGVREIAHRDVKVEEGGVLIGNIFKRAGGEGYLVEITDHIFDEEARGTQFELRYTFEAWQKRSAQLKERAPGSRILGWYHTHLVKLPYLDDENNVQYESELFFSRDDHFMHRQFFPDKWYVAMVLNPEGEAVFFNWRGNEIVQARGFFVYRPQALPEFEVSL